jgi:hypothetical protein
MSAAWGEVDAYNRRRGGITTMSARATAQRWDVGDEVVTRAPRSPIRSFIASTAVTLVVPLMAIVTQPGFPKELAFVSKPYAIVETIRINRKAQPRVSRRDSMADGTDTRIGMSTARLAEVFPRLFAPLPADDEPDEPPFFLS